MSEPDLPDELRGPLIKLWRMPPISVKLLPRDAFTAVAALQYATRNPQLSDIQRQQAVAVARVMQAALAQIDPIINKYLEMGWDTRYDAPKDDPPF